MNDIEKLKQIPESGNIALDIRAILQESRALVARTVNTAMVAAYWMIGRRIVVEEQRGEDRAAYGEKLLKNLSRDLTAEFGNGFSYANLRMMRQFYRTYPDFEICYTLCIKLPWSHNRLIMRVSDPNAREWYLKTAASEQWSVRQLERNINSFCYQRQLDSGDICSDTKDTDAASIDVKQFVKDPYVIEFVGLPPYPHHKEKALEERLIANMQDFLLELGRGFSFVKRQYRISTETAISISIWCSITTS